MIFVRDKGQMCNNILQYGHMYAWGREHHKHTVSMRFAYKYQYFHICFTKYHCFLTYLFAKWGAALGLIPRVTFPFVKGIDTKPLEEKLLRHNLVVAEGWRIEFPELFLKYKDEIVALFQFRSVIKERVKLRMTGKCCDKALRLGIHVRRGDYKVWNDGRYYFDDETYAAYIRLFLAMHPDKKVVVFLSTNDRNVNEESFRSLCGHNAIYILNQGAAEDLCMLSECDYIIGPPSTFSLVASMYHDIPLHWMMDANTSTLKEGGFQNFDKLFREVL